jgi:hypothetical protein
MLAHCGLPWDPAVLEYYQNERSVLTASVSQVLRSFINSFDASASLDLVCCLGEPEGLHMVKMIGLAWQGLCGYVLAVSISCSVPEGLPVALTVLHCMPGAPEAVQVVRGQVEGV